MRLMPQLRGVLASLAAAAPVARLSWLRAGVARISWLRAGVAVRRRCVASPVPHVPTDAKGNTVFYKHFCNVCDATPKRKELQGNLTAAK